MTARLSIGPKVNKMVSLSFFYQYLVDHG